MNEQQILKYQFVKLVDYDRCILYDYFVRNLGYWTMTHMKYLCSRQPNIFLWRFPSSAKLRIDGYAATNIPNALVLFVGSAESVKMFGWL